MSEDLITALQITLVGMLLVFGAIILVSLLMRLLVMATGGKETPFAAARATSAPEAAPRSSAGSAGQDDPQRLAAAVAVALALAHENGLEPHPFEPSPKAPISPWQAVMRGRQLKQRGRTR
ncbi:MAG: hypothetical protein Kow00124_17840 [Anaerolineae bacterium]